MSILNVTPCKNVVESGGQIAQMPGDIHTDAAINISSDSSGTALPKLRGGNNEADYYRITTDGAMYIRIGSSSGVGTDVAVGDMLLSANETFFFGKAHYTHIAKLDKA